MGAKTRVLIECDSPNCTHRLERWAVDPHQAIDEMRVDGWEVKWWATGRCGYGGQPLGQIVYFCPTCAKRRRGGNG